MIRIKQDKTYKSVSESHTITEQLYRKLLTLSHLWAALHSYFSMPKLFLSRCSMAEASAKPVLENGLFTFIPTELHSPPQIYIHCGGGAIA